MPEKIIELETKMGKGWKVTAQVREHTLVIDQPTAGNEGANPLETFLFSLGGCISAIARMVAREQKIDLRGMNIKVRGEMNSDGLLGKASEDPVGFRRITLDADIDADMTAEQKQQFLDTVCHRCPVHDHLLSASRVEHQSV
ncbi:OsmC family protein [Shewanella algae]|uniref:OsmC family protein n=1 Tax=Shewanella algae TaxID=38313 RepID=UPI002936AF5E|nr:OsmC family protein [Shewanella algae]MDV2962382.1 OsmC family protein [Shewanella algae]